MRILVAGGRFWACHKLAAAILRWMTVKYGQDIVIVHGDETGAAESFATAAKGLRIRTEEHPADSQVQGKTTPLYRFVPASPRKYRVSPPLSTPVGVPLQIVAGSLKSWHDKETR